MRVNVDIDGTDETADVFSQDGIGELAYVSEDEDGDDNVPSVAVKLSAMDRVDEFEGASLDRVTLRAGGNLVFSGMVSGKGAVVDRDQETVEFEALGEDRDLVERLKSLQVKDPSDPTKFLPVIATMLDVMTWDPLPYPSPDFVTVSRFFYPVVSTLEMAFSMLGRQVVIPSEFDDCYVGGKKFTAGQNTDTFPFDNAWDFFAATLKLFNLRWHIIDSVVYVRAKDDVRKARAADTPIDLPVICDTFSMEEFGYDQVRLTMGEWSASIERSGVSILNVREIESELAAAAMFGTAIYGTRPDLEFVAIIPQEADEKNYILRSTTGTWDGMRRIHPSEVLQNHHQSELDGVAAFSCDYSLQDDADSIPALIVPYARVAGPGLYRWYLAQVRLNLQDERAHVRACCYDPDFRA